MLRNSVWADWRVLALPVHSFTQRIFHAPKYKQIMHKFLPLPDLPPQGAGVGGTLRGAAAALPTFPQRGQGHLAGEMSAG
ncbi:MAG: hypothetical protein Fur0018_06330 [Anaerolineales bacterium]